MNNVINFRATALACVLAITSVPSTSNLFAQAQTPDPNAQKDEQKVQTFVGKIVQLKSGVYALLMNEQQGTGVYLDDQDRAKQFEGKNVKVTGTIDVPKGLVHVMDIAAS